MAEAKAIGKGPQNEKPPPTQIAEVLHFRSKREEGSRECRSARVRKRGANREKPTSGKSRTQNAYVKWPGESFLREEVCRKGDLGREVSREAVRE